MVCSVQGARKSVIVVAQEDWLHLVGLIHDLGKVLAHPCFGSQPQWAVVGDTWPTGCAHDPRVVFAEFFQGGLQPLFGCHACHPAHASTLPVLGARDIPHTHCW